MSMRFSRDNHRAKSGIKHFLRLMIFMILAWTSFAPMASAQCFLSGAFCTIPDCIAARSKVIEHHEDGEQRILAHMRELFHTYREFIVREFFQRIVLPSLMLMTEQMSNIAMFQVEIVGEIFDAKLHLETQRLFNELKNEANRDYYPVQSFCIIGTNVRSLSASERISTLTQGALEKKGMTRLMGSVGDGAAEENNEMDKRGRWQQFVQDNCDINDNNRKKADAGLQPPCGSGGSDHERINRDVEYSRFIEEPRTLNVKFHEDAGLDTALDPVEEDVMLMANNLYGHDVPRRDMGFLNRKSGQILLMRQRSIQAKRSVAMNTFNAIVGMKSVSSDAEGNSAQYLRAIVKDLGMSDKDIERLMGTQPSYYAQLEILGKTMFENVDFFTELYDKPANIERKSAALNAIELMLDRAIYESELRHEMLYSVLLSSYLEEDAKADYERFMKAAKTPRR